MARSFGLDYDFAMTRHALLISAFLAPLYAPIGFAVVLALSAALFFPLAPLAVGLFVDALYFNAAANTLPLYTLLGAVASALALLVRSYGRARIIGR